MLEAIRAKGAEAEKRAKTESEKQQQEAKAAQKEQERLAATAAEAKANIPTQEVSANATIIGDVKDSLEDLEASERMVDEKLRSQTSPDQIKKYIQVISTPKTGYKLVSHSQTHEFDKQNNKNIFRIAYDVSEQNIKIKIGSEVIQRQYNAEGALDRLISTACETESTNREDFQNILEAAYNEKLITSKQLLTMAANAHKWESSDHQVHSSTVKSAVESYAEKSEQIIASLWKQNQGPNLSPITARAIVPGQGQVELFSSEIESNLNAVLSKLKPAFDEYNNALRNTNVKKEDYLKKARQHLNEAKESLGNSGIDLTVNGLYDAMKKDSVLSYQHSVVASKGKQAIITDLRASPAKAIDALKVISSQCQGPIRENLNLAGKVIAAIEAANTLDKILTEVVDEAKLAGVVTLLNEQAQKGSSSSAKISPKPPASADSASQKGTSLLDQIKAKAALKRTSETDQIKAKKTQISSHAESEKAKKEAIKEVAVDHGF